MMGLAIELCGCESPSPLQLSQLEEILYDFSDELGISKIEAEAFVRKMESNGRLRYALNVLKSVVFSENQLVSKRNNAVIPAPSCARRSGRRRCPPACQ